MTETSARCALAGTALGAGEVVGPVGEGWFSWTFEVDSEWMVRFPRDDAVATRHAKEQRLLPSLAARADFAVPVPQVLGSWAGRPFSCYRKLPGRPAQVDDLAPEQLAGLLRSLHAFPADEARRLIGEPGTAEDWAARYWHLKATSDRRVVPLLEPMTAQRLDAAFTRFFALAAGVPLTLIHGDLGVEHVLIGADRPGVIDFEFAAVGDPTLDFIGIWLAGGPDITESVVAAYGPVDDDFWFRLRFYAAMGSVHAIIYALDHDDPDLRVDASRRLDERLAGLT